MLNKSLFYFPLLLGLGALLAAAWPGGITPPASSPPIDFVPKALDLPSLAQVAGKLSAKQILDKALEVLAAERTWLKTKIRQMMTDKDCSYVAEGFLQRGPNHCARLELHVRSGSASTRMLVVSDGALLACEGVPSTKEGKVECTDLPAEPDAREAFLAAKGCGGPRSMLQQLSPHLQNLTFRTGLLEGKPVVYLKGELDNKPAHFALTSTPIRVASLFLDATTLWPMRVEFWTAQDLGSSRCALQIDFRDPEFDKELPLEECERLFSYQPPPSAATR